ncbi:hypothetical protein [Fontivita pretiosa]|uniref:hypothetical protein n=1 Tax=Fontivita pretiosa TaxID=2989684 RepID=UPI003D1724BF
MGIRDSMNQHPKVTAAVVGIILLAALGVLIAQLLSSDTGMAAPEGGSEPKAWYTVDDGKTFFADSALKIPPFEHEGKIAYRCQVWTYDGGKTKFVSHLERYPEAVKKKLESMDRKDPGAVFELRMIEVKRPGTGDNGWVSIDSPAAAQIMTPQVPPGKEADLQLVPAG